MKIAIVVHELNICGGTHKQVMRLCQYLNGQGHECTVYTKYFDPERTYPEFCKLKVVSLYSAENENLHRNSKMKIRQLLQSRHDDAVLLSKIPIDTKIINVHDNNLQGLMYLAIKKHAAKIVWQINDLPEWFFVGVNEHGDHSALDGLKRLRSKRIAKKVSSITVNVTKNKQRIADCMGVDANVFYSGVDLNPELKPHAALKVSKEIRLLSTGIFFPYRNYETIIEVVDLLKQKGYNASLDIIGSTQPSPDYALQIQSLIYSKGLQDRVKVWGQVDENTFNSLHNRANIFLFININQSWGLAVFEAMSGGLPVIVSNSVGVTELLHDGEDAIIVNPMDVLEICRNIERLANNPEVYLKISHNAAKAAKNLTFEKLYGEKMLNLFNNLVKE